MIEKLFYFLQGYLILELYGDSKERFINLCKNKEIEMTQIFMINKQWFCKIKCRDFIKIKTFIKKTGCMCKIKKKCGLPFMLRKIKSRKGILMGSVLFYIILTQCSGRIWNISVDGGFLHTREQILQVMAEELGVYGGISGSQIDCFEIEKKLRLDYNEIGWISVEKKGCKLHVMLNESTMPKESVQREYAAHIVAEHDGIVRKVEVMSGVPMVKAGDEVKKGDILISGILTFEGDYDEIIRKEPVGAEGKVYLESDFSYQAGYSLTYEQKNYKNKRYGLEFFMFDKKIFSYIPRYSEGKYDIMSIDIVPFCFEDYKVPVLFKKYKLLAYDSELIKLTETELSDKIKNDWNEFLADWEKQGVQIIRNSYTTDSMLKKCIVNGTITACGNFISYQEILEEEWKNKDEYSGNNP